MAAQKRGLLMRTVAIFIAINPSETERQAEKWNNLPTSREPIPPCNLNAFCFSDPATPFPHHQGFSHVIPSGGNSTALGSRATFTLLYRNNHVTRMSCSTTTPFPPPPPNPLTFGSSGLQQQSQLVFFFSNLHVGWIKPAALSHTQPRANGLSTDTHHKVRPF